MSIANGDFLLNQIYINNTGAKKIYKGADLVYDRSLKNKFEYFYVYERDTLGSSPFVVGTVSLQNNGGNTPDVEYSRDGVNWTTWDYSSLDIYGPVSNGDNIEYSFIFFRGNNPNGFSYSDPVSSKFIITDTFSGGSHITIGGNIMSLLYKDSFWKEDIYPNNTIPNDYCFMNLFNSSDIYSCAGGPEEYNGYNAGAFRLPAMNLTQHCYDNLFCDCHKLVYGPNIFPAKTLAERCYQGTFARCESLLYAPRLSATTLANYCCSNMFLDCHVLETAPVLLAKTLTYRCYEAMFARCYAINYVKALCEENIDTTNLQIWLYGVSNNSSKKFVKKTGVTFPWGESGIPTQWTVEEI